jgi:predicted enzyme related to lactoylglutathione lyase
MPQVDSHVPGSFCWLELATTDQNAAKQFYSALLGWQHVDSPMGPDAFYTMFNLEGRHTGACYTMDANLRAQGVPPHWMLYVDVTDADATAGSVSAAGGQVVVGPFDVFDFGRMAVLRDPAGAAISIWQPNTHLGFGIEGVPGTLCWADLMTSNADAAKAFYNAVFLWQFDPGQGDNSGYLHVKNGDKFIGGMPPAQHVPPNTPPHWLAYILVENCDASTTKAQTLGARVYMGPMTMENVGRWSVIADPQGAVIALFQPTH